MIQNFVTLEPTQHKYFDRSGNEYTSVSKVLNSLSTEKDWDRIAGVVCGKGKFKGMSKEDVLKLWDDNRIKASDHGTRIHNALERYCKEFKILDTDKDLEGLIKDVYETYSDYHRTFDECALYSEKHQIAGTADKILQVSKNGKYFDIEDYKTNLSKGIQYNNKDNEYLSYPVAHLQDCNFNKYALQLSIYSYMFEQLTGNFIRNLWIRFIPPNFEEKSYKIMIPYLKLEAEAVLDNYCKNKILLEIPNF